MAKEDSTGNRHGGLWGTEVPELDMVVADCVGGCNKSSAKVYAVSGRRSQRQNHRPRSGLGVQDKPVVRSQANQRYTGTTAFYLI